MQKELTTLPIGAVIRGRYIVEDLLGKGDSGAIYLVRDQHIRHAKDNLFVLKQVKGPSQQRWYRLIQHWYRLNFEGASLKRLYHEALPRIHRVFNDGKRDWVYIVMEYIEGPNLETLRQQQPEQRFLYLEAINFMAPIIDAVRYLHRQQPPIIHRDIRPANIIMPRTGARAVLVNLGIGKEYSPDSTAAMVQSYSPNYRAPELYSGGGDTRTDIYGLGATFYTLVMGIVPTDARSRMTQLDSTGVDPLKPVHEVVPTIPVLVVRAIYKAMAIHAYNRFSSVGQFWEELWMAALNPLSAEQPLPAFTPTPISNASEKKSIPSVPALPSTSARLERAVEHMPDDVKEQEDLDATEPLPKLSPVAPELVDVKEQEDVDTTKSLPKLPPDAPLSTCVKEQEDLDDVMLLRKPPRVERAPISWRKLGLLFIVLALLISLGISASVLPHAQSDSITLAPTAASPAPASTSTSTSAIYPTVTGTYNGTIYDVAVNVSTTISLTGLQQSQGNISGYLILGPKLQGSGPFNGTVDTAKHVQFTVTDAARNAKLFSQGAMQSPTSLSGDYYYCSPGPAQRGQCGQGPGGYGIWNAALAPSS